MPVSASEKRSGWRGNQTGAAAARCAGNFLVGLSKILDKELKRRKPVERSHREVVGTAVVDSKLVCEIL